MWLSYNCERMLDLYDIYIDYYRYVDVVDIYMIYLTNLSNWHNAFSFYYFSRFLEAEGLEKTYKFSQREISKSVDVASAAKVIVVHK